VRRLDGRALGALASGHVCADMCQGAVPAMLPFLASHRGYSFAALGSLVLAATVGSSLLQPLFGVAADRATRAWMMPAGVVVAGGGVGLAGIAPSYLLTALAIAASGIGVAAFHPEAARLAGIASRDERGRGMSFFSVGGNAGFALGPIVITPLVLLFGLGGTLGVLVPVAAALAVLTVARPRFERLRKERRDQVERPDPAAVPLQDDRSAFIRLSAVVGLRSVIFFGLQAFIPSYFVHELGASEGLGNAALTAMLVCGAIGTLAGGLLGDRRGLRLVLLGSIALLIPLLVALPTVGTLPAFALLTLIGLGVIASFSTTVVLGQAYLPSRPGLASGVTMGAAIGFGGIAAAVLGPVADAAGTQTVLWIIAVVPLPALLIAAGLPPVATPRRRQPARPPASGPQPARTAALRRSP
jgi:MFS transporter, FSR family, fosmidomycin resistance protein